MSARPHLIEETTPPRSRPVRSTARMRLAISGSQRRARTSRLQHAAVMRILVTAFALTAIVMTYVMLTAMLTRTNYQVVHAERERLALQDETLRMDDRLERLESRDRLAALAAKLGMKDASVYAVVEVPRLPAPPAGNDRGLAFFPSLAGWIK